LAGNLKKIQNFASLSRLLVVVVRPKEEEEALSFDGL
jgi:hypothetical protein